MTIGDGQDVTKVTAFDRDAQEILYIQVEKALEIRSQVIHCSLQYAKTISHVADSCIRLSNCYYLFGLLFLS